MTDIADLHWLIIGVGDDPRATGGALAERLRKLACEDVLQAADLIEALSSENTELKRQLAEADGALAWRAKVRRDASMSASDYHRIEQEATARYLKRYASRQSADTGKE